MQHSTSSTCVNSLTSPPMNVPANPTSTNISTLPGNHLERDSVGSEEITHHSLQDYPASKEVAVEWSDCSNDTVPTPSSTSLGKRKKREWATFLPLALDIISCSAAKTSQSEEHRPDRQRTTRTRGSSTSTSSPVRKRRRTHGSAAPSRNKQATTIDQEEYIRLKLSLCQVNRGGPNDLDCPVEGCHYIQMNGRMPDLRRHIRTHIRKDAEIRCKGVPWQDFMQHRHPFPTISDEQPYAVPNEDGLWIGGCLKTFSRADALKRHLRNTSCMGLDHKQHH